MTRGSTIQQFERAFDPSMEVHLPERPATVASRGEVVTPYANSWEYLCDKLHQLDLRIERELLQMGLRHPVNPLEQFKGLVVSEEEVAALIARDRRSAILGEADGTHSSELEACTGRLDKMRQDIQARLQLTEEAGTKLSLLWLACLLGLTPFEQECVLICFAPELDRKYEKLYAYLQDDVTRKKATLDLILNLAESGTDQVAARNSFTAQAPLLKYGLIQVNDHSPDGQAPLLSRALKLDDRIVNFLLELPQLDGRLESVANLSLTSRPGDEMLVNHSIRQRLLELLHKEVAGNENAAGRVCVHLHGPGGSGKHASMRALARELGLPPLLADAGRIAAGGLPLEQTALLLGREALLQPALLCIDNLDALLAGEPAQQNQLRTLIQTVFNFTRVAVVISRRERMPRECWDERLFGPNGVFLSVPLARPDETARSRIWRETLGELATAPPELDCGALAGRFQLTAGQIRNAVVWAKHQALWRGGDLTVSDFYSACREQSDQSLGTLAKKVVPKYAWADIVLPDDTLAQLHEICQRVTRRQRVLRQWGFDQKLSQGKGINALFAGPSGTGKTMAAEIIAGELGLDLYRIDLSGIVSKYIGETEKNLDRIFTAAREANAILFFDEADALFGKRSEVRDSHDRYANIEISYLLQKMEEYEGVALLATNLRQNLDDSFLRRLAFTIHFPFPDEHDRHRIWSRIWPTETPLDPDVDLELMARQFKLSGGNIRNIALAAAFLAAENGNVVTMKHLLRATRREYQKLGKPLNEADLGIGSPQ